MSVARKTSKWVTSTAYPLSKDIWKASFASEGKRDQSRAHIVSPKLCDDIVKRLAPSLKDRPTCDIIDLFPGAGLFSSKVHDFFKPRRHLLIEPNVKEYLPFLQPLLDRPNSSYQHLSWDPLDSTTYDRVFDEGHLPEQSGGKELEEKQHERGTNDTLLVLANLTHKRSTAALRSNTPLAYMMSQYLKACFNQSLFHRYGLVRVIATLPRDDAEVILPRLIRNRKKISCFGEATALSLHEVAGVQTDWTQFKEWEMIEASADTVSKKAQSLEIETPEGRELEKAQSAPFPKTGKEGDPPGVLRTKYEWHDELTELEAAFDRGEIQFLKTRRPRKDQASAAKPKENKEQEAATKKRKRFSSLRSRIKQENGEFHAALMLVDLQAQIDELEQEIAIELTKPPEARNQPIESQMAKLKSLTSDLHACFASSTEPSQRRALIYTDDRRSYRNGGKDSILLWERREYEPLLIHPEEIYPRNPCSVLDFQPDPNAPILKSTTPDKMEDENEDFEEFPSTYRIFLHLLNHMTNNGTKTIPELIDTMFTGRSTEEVVRAVPSLLQVARATVPESASKDISTSTSASNSEPASAPEDQDSSKFPKSPVIKKPLELETRNPEDPSSYDLSQTRLRTVPPHLFWDLALEWGRWPFRPESEREVVNMLGGKLSSGQT